MMYLIGSVIVGVIAGSIIGFMIAKIENYFTRNK